MKKISRVFLFFIFVLFLSHVFPNDSLAVRPYLITEDAIPVERGNSRLDVGFSFKRISSNDRRYQLVGDFTQGVLNNLDFGIAVPIIFRSGQKSSEGIGDITIKSKLRFLKGREANPLSLTGQLFIKFPSCDDKKDLSDECTGETDVGLLGIASKEFFPVTVHLNVGYILVGNPSGQAFRDVFRYSLVLDYLTVFDALRAFGELAGETQRNPEFSTDPVALNFGAVYQVVSQVFLDGSFGFGLTQASPDVFLNTGLSYRF